MFLIPTLHKSSILRVPEVAPPPRPAADVTPGPGVAEDAAAMFDAVLPCSLRPFWRAATVLRGAALGACSSLGSCLNSLGTRWARSTAAAVADVAGFFLVDCAFAAAALRLGAIGNDWNAVRPSL